MTLDEAIKKIQAIIDCDLRELNTMPQHEALRNEVEALDMAIKVLKQQSDDCVSRAEILEEMSEREKNGDRITLGYIKNMSPATPTHGMCKDCTKSKILNRFEGNSIVCSRFGRMAVNPDFYCADFEKRGNKDGKN